MGRMGHPAELTGTIVLPPVCSRTGRYIDDADILIDGEA
jgi:hypothetical protein